MDDAAEDYRCGFCLEKHFNMVDPRQLPCKHVFCHPCLQADRRRNSEDFTCPICKRFYAQLEFGGLNSGCLAKSMDGNIIPCDSCKTDVNNVAKVFCVSCEKTLCERHEQFHDEVFDCDHDKVSVETYVSSEGKYRKSKCSEHPKENLILACEVCHKLFCEKCDKTQECDHTWKDLKENRANATFQTLHNIHEEKGTKGFRIKSKAGEGFQNKLMADMFFLKPDASAYFKSAKMSEVAERKDYFEPDVNTFRSTATTNAPIAQRHDTFGFNTPSRHTATSSGVNLKTNGDLVCSPFVAPSGAYETKTGFETGGIVATTSSVGVKLQPVFDFGNAATNNLSSACGVELFKFGAKHDAESIKVTTTSTGFGCKPSLFSFGTPATTSANTRKVKDDGIVGGTSAATSSSPFGAQSNNVFGRPAAITPGTRGAKPGSTAATMPLKAFGTNSDASGILVTSGSSKPKAFGAEIGNKVHQLVALSDFMESVTGELRDKLADASRKQTELYIREKEAWREIDKVEGNGEDMKRRVDGIVKERCDALLEAATKFKMRVDKASRNATDAAAQYASVVMSKCDQLAQIEASMSTQLRLGDATRLVETLHSHMAKDMFPSEAIQFSAQRMSVSSFVSNPKFDIDLYRPTKIVLISTKSTLVRISSVLFSDEQSLVIATSANTLEIWDLEFNVLSSISLENELVDMALYLNNLLVLEKAEIEVQLNVYSRNLQFLYTLHRMDLNEKCFNKATAEISVFCGKIAILNAGGHHKQFLDPSSSLVNSASVQLLDSSGHIVKFLSMQEKLQSIFYGSKDMLLFAHSVGVGVIDLRGYCLQREISLLSVSNFFKSDTLLTNRKSVDHDNSGKPALSGFSAASQSEAKQADSESLAKRSTNKKFSKTKCAAGFVYLSDGRGRIIAINDANMETATLINLELLKMEDISGIAVRGDKLAVACGSEGLKLFKII